MKLGHIDYLNAYPFYWRMLRMHSLPAGVELISRTPAVLNEMMRLGELDVSLLSTASLPDLQDDVVVLSDFCIGSCGAVRSVLLFSQYPLDALDAKSIDVTSESETSAVLLRYLLEQCYGVKPDYRTHRIEHSGGAVPAAVLRIGNSALKDERSQYPYVYDLGQLWHDRMGVPMVYAVFVARHEVVCQQAGLLAAVRQAVADSLAAARADRSRFIELAAAAYPEVKTDLPAYYEALKYDLHDAYQSGLRMFFDKMAAVGLLPPMGDISYV